MKGVMFTDPKALAEECESILTQILNAAPLFDLDVTHEFYG
jgi:hypothetical protein